jgi:microcompartment protein CcmK/EutM
MSQREPLARRALRQRIAKEGRLPTMLEVAVMSVGVLRGSEALWGLLMWTVARRKKGGEAPTYQDLMATSLVSRPAAFRQQALLREVWGGDEGIALVADVLEDSCGAAIGELVTLSTGGDRATAMMLVGSLPAPGFAL